MPKEQEIIYDLFQGNVISNIQGVYISNALWDTSGDNIIVAIQEQKRSYTTFWIFNYDFSNNSTISNEHQFDSLNTRTRERNSIVLNGTNATKWIKDGEYGNLTYILNVNGQNTKDQWNIIGGDNILTFTNDQNKNGLNLIFHWNKTHHSGRLYIYNFGLNRANRINIFQMDYSEVHKVLVCGTNKDIIVSKPVFPPEDSDASGANGGDIFHTPYDHTMEPTIIRPDKNNIDISIPVGYLLGVTTNPYDNRLVRFAPDGNRFATSTGNFSIDGNLPFVYVWDLSMINDSEKYILQEYFPKDINDVLNSPDEKYRVMGLSWIDDTRIMIHFSIHTFDNNIKSMQINRNRTIIYDVSNTNFMNTSQNIRLHTIDHASNRKHAFKFNNEYAVEPIDFSNGKLARAVNFGLDEDAGDSMLKFYPLDSNNAFNNLNPNLNEVFRIQEETNLRTKYIQHIRWNHVRDQIIMTGYDRDNKPKMVVFHNLNSIQSSSAVTQTENVIINTDDTNREIENKTGIDKNDPATSHTIVENEIITNRNIMNSSIANSTRLKELAWVKQKENNRGHFSTDETNNHIYNIGHHSLRPITGSHADRLLFQHIKHNHLLLPSTSSRDNQRIHDEPIHLDCNKKLDEYDCPVIEVDKNIPV